MDRATEKVVDRLAERLAEDVPERELDRPDRTVQHRPAARVFVAVHRLHKPFDLEG